MQISAQWNKQLFTDRTTKLPIGAGAYECGFNINTPLPDISIFNFAFKYVEKPYTFYYGKELLDIGADGIFYSVPCAYTYYGPVYVYHGSYNGGRWAYNQTEKNATAIYSKQYCPILQYDYNKLFIYIYGIDTTGATVDLSNYTDGTSLSNVVGIVYYNGIKKNSPINSDTNRGYFAPLVYGNAKPPRIVDSKTTYENAILFSLPGGSIQIPFPILGNGHAPGANVSNDTVYGKPDNIVINDTDPSIVKATLIYKRTKEQIINAALQYGYIVTTSENDAINCKTNSVNTYYPTINDDGKIDPTKHTNGENNKNQRQASWTDPSDPWSKGGFTGDVDPNDYTDKIDLNKPSLTTTGIFNRTFAINGTNINKLSDFLWNADESIFNEIVKGLSLIGGNPIDGLIDLRLYPFDIVSKTASSGASKIVVGRTDTGVTGVKINDYNAILDLGECSFYRKFNNFLDFEPFTTGSLYIPYVGIVPISTADFMGQTISCKMVVDITTGSCTAIVFANNIPIIYKNGNIGVEIPMTGSNSAEYASRVMGGLTSGAADIALGAASKSVGQVVSGVGSIVDSALSVNNTMYNTAGSSSPACGLWQPQNCYFIIQRPVPIVPDNYGHTVGYACNYQSTIGECSGYTQTYNADVSTINAPESEKNAIAEILNSGFYA